MSIKPLTKLGLEEKEEIEIEVKRKKTFENCMEGLNWMKKPQMN